MTDPFDIKGIKRWSPITVIAGGHEKFCCRICIARYGLNANAVEIATIKYCFDTPTDFDKHMQETHKDDTRGIRKDS